MRDISSDGADFSEDTYFFDKILEASQPVELSCELRTLYDKLKERSLVNGGGYVTWEEAHEIIPQNISETQLDQILSYLCQAGDFSLIRDEDVEKFKDGYSPRKNMVEDLPVPKLTLPSTADLVELTPEEEKVAFATRHFGKIIDAYQNLVIFLANKYKGRGVSQPYLIEKGNAALTRAIEEFDLRKGYRFSNFATWYIRQELVKVIADTARKHEDKK